MENLKWVVVTNKRQFVVEGNRHKDAENEAWKLHQDSEEILYISKKALFDMVI
jgi:hypothetical protein